MNRMRSMQSAWLMIFVLACGSDESPTTEEATTEESAQAAAPEAFSATSWTTLLSTHVTDDGFKYEALRGNEEHRAALAALVAAAAATDTSSMERDEALAFYINAYNVLTVNAVLELWPVESVMQQDGFFEERKHQVAGQELTLNALENEVIRGERFSEPRIHFAVNCASVGCPPLQREAFTAENLESKLAAATRAFVRNTTRIDRDDNHVQATKLFEWFADDFGDVREFIASQLEDEDAAFVRREQTEIQHFDYDWALNGAS